MWRTIIKDGAFGDDAGYDLKPRKWLWTAILFARLHLRLHPFRQAHIVKG